MRNKFVMKVALSGMFTAVAVVGSMIQFPVFGSQCAPVQHMVNVLCAVLLGTGLRRSGGLSGQPPAQPLQAWGACWPSPAACAAPCCAA